MMMKDLMELARRLHDIGGEPVGPLGIALAHMGECGLAMVVAETLREEAVIQQIEF
jgi:hypothetical protein